MISVIRKQNVQRLISEIIGYNIMLKDGQYLQFSINNIEYISYSDKVHSLVLPSGIIIMDHFSDGWSLLPSIMKLLEINRKITITSTSDITNITSGHPINIIAENGLVLLVDPLNRNLSLGDIDEYVFHPFVDLGFYLRSESKQ